MFSIFSSNSIHFALELLENIEEMSWSLLSYINYCYILLSFILNHYCHIGHTNIIICYLLMTFICTF